VFEAGDGPGGTWYWNRYPGARCDVESMEYSYSFSPELEQDWDWTERYSTQPEILRYVEHVVDRFDLQRDIQFSTRVESAVYHEDTNLWAVTVHSGETVWAHHCIMATGCLSSANLPEIAGIGDFKGASYQTSLWPHEGVDFTGQRVGIIGTGSSAIQSIPVIAEQAAELTVFQRTPNFVVPAHNHVLDAENMAAIKADYRALRNRLRTEEGAAFSGSSPTTETLALEVSEAERNAVFEDRWAHGGLSFLSGYPDIGADLAANDTAAEFIRGKIRSIVDDPGTAELLCPKGYPAGAKRLCVDTGYFETYNRDNVRLVDLNSQPIKAITATGLETATRDFQFDALIYATGFDAMTGTLGKIRIAGRGGRLLTSKWAAGPLTYLGLMSEGFPNLYMITGPGSPSVLSNMIVSIEQHVEWIADCVATVGKGWIEPTSDAETNWVAHVNMVADLTVYPYANSWYLGANVPGKPRIFMPYIGGVPGYRLICDDVVAKGYAGFAINGTASDQVTDPLEFLDIPEEAIAAA
jgi:cyclohexanone monooxygenase